MSTATALRSAATNQVARPKTIYEHMDNPRFASAIGAVAGKYLTADRMLRLCINAVKKTPRLMECDPQSVLGAMMASAALGLEPNTVQQQAFLIPYGRNVKDSKGNWSKVYDCQFQVGARGFVTLAYRSPEIKTLQAGAIHDGDKWEQEEGSQSFLRYAKALRDRGPLLGSFSYVRFTSGDEGACVLPLDEIMKIRERSETFRSLRDAMDKAKDERDRGKALVKFNEQPWIMWEDDMAQKSAIKKHAKLLPLTGMDAMAIAADLDDKGEAGTLDMRAFTDVDTVRAVVNDEAEAPALEHQPAEQIEGGTGEAFGATARQAEAVHAKPATEQAEKPAAAKKARSSASAPAKRTYAQLADGVLNAADEEDAAQILDEARDSLDEAGQRDLAKVFNNKWRA